MNTATTDGLLDELRRVKAERDAWAAQYQKAQQEAAVAIGQRDQALAGLDSALDELRARTAERDTLAARLEVVPAMREVIGELRTIHAALVNGHSNVAFVLSEGLLRRLDRESLNKGG